MSTEITKEIKYLENKYYRALEGRKLGLWVLAVVVLATGLDVYFGYSDGVVGYVCTGAAICYCITESDKASKARGKLDNITIQLFGKRYKDSSREILSYKYGE